MSGQFLISKLQEKINYEIQKYTRGGCEGGKVEARHTYPVDIVFLSKVAISPV